MAQSPSRTPSAVAGGHLTPPATAAVSGHKADNQVIIVSERLVHGNAAKRPGRTPGTYNGPRTSSMVQAAVGAPHHKSAYSMVLASEPPVADSASHVPVVAVVHNEHRRRNSPMVSRYSDGATPTADGSVVPFMYSSKRSNVDSVRRNLDCELRSEVVAVPAEADGTHPLVRQRLVHKRAQSMVTMSDDSSDEITEIFVKTNNTNFDGGSKKAMEQHQIVGSRVQQVIGSKQGMVQQVVGSRMQQVTGLRQSMGQVVGGSRQEEVQQVVGSRQEVVQQVVGSRQEMVQKVVGSKQGRGQQVVGSRQRQVGRVVVGSMQDEVQFVGSRQEMVQQVVGSRQRTRQAVVGSRQGMVQQVVGSSQGTRQQVVASRLDTGQVFVSSQSLEQQQRVVGGSRQGMVHVIGGSKQGRAPEVVSQFTPDVEQQVVGSSMEFIEEPVGGNQDIGQHLVVVSSGQPVGGSRQSLVQQQQPAAGSRQSLGQQQQPVGGSGQSLRQQQQPVGGSRQSLVQQQQPVAGSRQSLGQQQQPVAGSRQFLGQQQQPVAGSRQSLGQQQQHVGGSRQSLGQQQQPVGGSRQSLGQQQQPVGGSRQSLGQQQQPAGGSRQSLAQQQQTDGDSRLSLGQQQQQPAGGSWRPLDQQQPVIGAKQTSGREQQQQVAGCRRWLGEQREAVDDGGDDIIEVCVKTVSTGHDPAATPARPPQARAPLAANNNNNEQEEEEEEEEITEVYVRTNPPQANNSLRKHPSPALPKKPPSEVVQKTAEERRKEEEKEEEEEEEEITELCTLIVNPKAVSNNQKPAADSDSSTTQKVSSDLSSGEHDSLVSTDSSENASVSPAERQLEAGESTTTTTTTTTTTICLPSLSRPVSARHHSSEGSRQGTSSIHQLPAPCTAPRSRHSEFESECEPETSRLSTPPAYHRAQTAKRRRLGDKVLPLSVRDLVAEARGYLKLVDFERKIDDTLLRKRVQMEASSRTAAVLKRKLRIFVWNTFHPGVDAKAPPSWELRIEGRLLMTTGAVAAREASSRKFSSFFRSLVVELDERAYGPEGGVVVEWHRTPATVETDGFQVRRDGAHGVQCRIYLMLNYQPMQFKLDPQLAYLLGFHTQTRAATISALWQYVKTHQLQDAERLDVIRCDRYLEHLFKCSTMRFVEIPHKISALLYPADPIVIRHTISADANALSCYDVDVDVEEAAAARCEGLAVTHAERRRLDDLDDTVSRTVESIRRLMVNREFFLGFASEPQQFVHKWLLSQSADLKVLADLVGNPEYERKAAFYFQPVIREAVERYRHRKTWGGVVPRRDTS